MENPWPQLPTDAPRVLPSDRSIIEAFNTRYADKHESDCRATSCAGCFTVQTRLLPEPFIGDPSARVYVLNLNPGYSPEDDAWHAEPDYRTAIIDNLDHKTAAFPFYFFDPRLKDAPGSTWWRQRSRWWIRDVGIETLARNLFCAELFPYHSRRYRHVPKTMSPDGLAPSSRYAAHLVREAIRTHRPIVAMRAFRAWCELIPELGGYGKVFHIGNPQNVSLSPNNLDGYSRLVGELRAT